MLDFVWLVYSTMCWKSFSIYGVHITRKCIESMHFYSCHSFRLKTPGRSFWKCVSPKTKEVKKTVIALSKFVQKIWRWLGTLGSLYFIWFIIFLNVMALQFCKWYLSNSAVLSLLPLLCNHGNLTRKLHQKKIATLMKGGFL